MKKVIRSEVKTGIWNIRFFGGMVLLLVISVISGNPYLDQLIHMGVSEGNSALLSYFEYCINASQTLLFVPVLIPLAAGAMAEEELKSRFALFSCGRVGIKRYIMGKWAAAATAGGLEVVLAMCGVFVVCMIRLKNIGGMDSATMAGMETAGVVMGNLIRGFLYGALWSVVGSLFAVLTRNAYLSYGVPFILYYVLTVFQERYYRSLFFLSPRYLEAPVYYSNVLCILFLSVLHIGMGMFFVAAVRRRINHG